jgi:hypothetical protein
MNIKIDVNEARILKMAMDGLKPREIEKQIAAEMRSQVLQNIRNRMSSMAHTLVERDLDDAMKNAIIKEMQAKLKLVLTPTNIAKEFKRDDWEKLFEHVVQPVMTDFIECAMNEWLSLSIEVKGGKKKKTVDLCGIDSYTYRKK